MNIRRMIFGVVVVCALVGVGYSGTTTVSYQVSAGVDDGYAWGATEQDINSGYLMVGDDRDYTAPYYMSGVRFINVVIPRSATVIDAHLKVQSTYEGLRGQIYGVIQAEAADNAGEFGLRYIAAAAKTTAAVDWDHKTAWDAATWYVSPDISTVIQEVINRPTWNWSNSLVVFYSTRTDSGKSRIFASFEQDANYAAMLDITCEVYTISGYITIFDGNGLDGVLVSADNGGSAYTTASDGYYEVMVPYDWSGTVTPSMGGWVFDPPARSYENLIADQIGEDYIGTFQGIITLRANGTGDYPTIQAAIDAINPKDYVVTLLQPGIYTGAGNRDIDFLGKAITLRSTDPHDPNIVAATVIDCNGDPNNPHRGFYFHSGEDANSILDGFTVTNSWAWNGGGMYNSYSSPTVRNCIFSDNSAGQWGGGMFNWHSSPTVTNCTFRGNSAVDRAGGMWSDRSSPTVTNCVFSGNSADWSTSVMYIWYSGLLLTNCTFSGNLSRSGYGSGLYSGFYSSVTIRNCILLDGISSGPNASLSVTYSNIAGGYAGTGNIDTDPCFLDPGYWDPNGTPGDADDDFWVNGDYHLRPGSPCIDAGDPIYVAGPNETDMDGDPRIINGRVDIGVDEYNGPVNDRPVADAGPDQTVIDTDRNGVEQVTLEGSGSYDPDGTIANWRWTDDLGDTILDGEVVSAILSVGVHTITLEVTDDIGATETDTVVITVEARLYVDDDAPGDPGPGDPGVSDPNENGSPEHPFDAIQEAIDAAVDGDTVIVLTGTFTGTGNRDIDFNSRAIAVRSENGPENCIVDCQQQGRAFYFHSGEGVDSVVQGFTITGGNADNGGGIACTAGASPTISNNIFTNNSCSWVGGGIYCLNSTPRIINNLFVNNGAGNGGGAVGCTNSSASIQNCTVFSNTAGAGYQGGGISFSGISSAILQNSILWNNSPKQISVMWSAHLSISYSCPQGGQAEVSTYNGSFSWGSGNIDVDPCFVDPNNGNYHLHPDSPCIDTGDADFVSVTVTTDLDGRPRVVDGLCTGTAIADMGAYEFSYVNRGDFDGGCSIDFLDYSMLTLNWQEDAPFFDIAPWPAGDGIVDMNDLAILCDNWLAGV